MLTAVIFIAIIGVLIFAHELGHFLTARRNGIRAEEFGFGFPPRILGFQFVEGEKKEKFSELESVEAEKIEIKKGQEEISKETVIEKFRKVVKKIPVGKWRIIWGNYDGDDEKEKSDQEEIKKNKYEKGTIYSLNWIPLGGFVRIKGENGDKKESPDSFSSKGAWVRIKVLGAGVLMNFILAWILISVVYAIGAPEAIETDANVENSKIQISEVVVNSPAEKMGIKVGDEIFGFKSVKSVQDYINSNKGAEVILEIKRGKESFEVKGIPRVDAPAGQGALGIGLAETMIKKYPLHEAIWKGLITMFNLIWAMLFGIYEVLKNLLAGRGAGADVAGPVGIAVMTKQVATLGLIYLLQFSAILSINLGLINILPVPALDGGRILFILIEKIKGKPVAQKTEQLFHTVGFILLILLMLAVTFKDITKFIR